MRNLRLVGRPFQSFAFLRLVVASILDELPKWALEELLLLLNRASMRLQLMLASKP